MPGYLHISSDASEIGKNRQIRLLFMNSVVFAAVNKGIGIVELAALSDYSRK
jgi:hypothetical protein